jgi:predicted transcriptional regulator
MSKRAYTIELPAAFGRRVDRAARMDNKTPRALATEALDWYLLTRSLPEETPTPSELRAIRRGRAAYKRGEFVTLDELNKEYDLSRLKGAVRGKYAKHPMVRNNFVLLSPDVAEHFRGDRAVNAALRKLIRAASGTKIGRGGRKNPHP